jgi:hypothetical protein
MKYKITASVLTHDKDGFEVYETIYLQVLDLDESPAADIARLLNPEPEYEEEDEEGYTHDPDADIIRVVPAQVQLPPTWGKMKDEEPAKHGRQLGYDRDGIVQDIKANVLTTPQIAEKYGVPKQTVYNVKAKYVKAEDIAPDIEPEPTGERQEPVEPAPSEYVASRQKLEEKKAAADINLEKKIEEMVAEGCSMVELEMMFPSVPVAKLREIFEQFKDA